MKIQKKIIIFDVKTLHIVKSYESKNKISDLSSFGSFILVVENRVYDSYLRTFDLLQLNLQREYYLRSDRVEEIKKSPDNKHFFAISKTGESVKIYVFNIFSLYLVGELSPDVKNIKNIEILAFFEEDHKKYFTYVLSTFESDLYIFTNEKEMWKKLTSGIKFHNFYLQNRSLYWNTNFQSYQFDIGSIRSTNNPKDINIAKNTNPVAFTGGIKKHQRKINTIFKNNKNLIEIVKELLNYSVDELTFYSYRKSYRIKVDENFNIVVYNSKTKAKISTLESHKNHIYSLEANDDNLVSVDISGIVKIWDLTQIDRQISFIRPSLNLFFTEKDWLIWTENHDYLSSENGDKLFGFFLNQTAKKESDFKTFAKLPELLNFKLIKDLIDDELNGGFS